MASIRLVSLNIERAKHLDRVVPFLKDQKPDVCCFQEIREPDLSMLGEVLEATHVFTPMSIHPCEGSPAPTGIAIFSRFPIRGTRARYYRGKEGQPLKTLQTEDAKRKYVSESAMVTFADIEKGGEILTFATAHFTWTPNGEPDEFQRKDLPLILAILENSGEFVLTGDFNAPRGGEVFAEFAKRFKDNIPAKYVTSLDLELHRAAKERREEIANKMVDGLFTTPHYVASNVELRSGISDHAAILATIHTA